MKVLNVIVLFFVLLGLSACGNKILVGKDIPTKKLYVTYSNSKNVSEDEVTALQTWKKPDFGIGVGYKGGYRCEFAMMALEPSLE